MKKVQFVEKTFEHPIPAVDMVIFTVDEDKLKVLVIKMKKAPYENCWALPGGLVRTEESVEQAARRTLHSKTGVKNIFLEQLYTFGEINRDPFGRVVSIAYFALVSSNGLKLKTSEEYEGIEWVDVKNLPKMAYDHRKIVSVAVERLQGKLEYTNIVCNLLPREFTMMELQKTYEVILDKEFDKRNFQKKIHALKIVKKTNNMTVGKAHRPAALYEFIDKNPKIIQMM